MTARRLILSILGAALGALAFASAPALAFNSHTSPPTTVGEAGTGNGQFSNPDGVAVDQSTGDVYVVDSGNNRVEKFDAAGKYLSKFGGPGPGPGQFSGPTWVAVDNSGLSPGSVYVADAGNNRVEKFDSTGTYVSELTGTPTGAGGAVVPFRAIGGLSVDPSGNVWVSEPKGRAGHPEGALDEFASGGTFITSLGTNGAEFDPFNRTEGLAVDSQGAIYIFGLEEHLDALPPTLSPETFVDKYENRDTGVAIDPGNAITGGRDGVYVAGKVYILTSPHTYEEPWAVSQYPPYPCVETQEAEPNPENLGERRSELPHCPRLESFGIGSLGATGGVDVNGATGTVYVADRENNDVKIFTATVLPDVTTDEATGPHPTSATLTGVVNPDGTTITSCKFEYVSDTAFSANLANEVQTVTLSGATGGDFTLTFKSATTAPISYNARAEEVMYALAEIASVGENVEVTGPRGGPYKIKFKGLLSHANLPLLTADSSALTPLGATVTPATTTEGGDGWGTVAAAPCSPNPLGSAPVAVHAEVTGLEPEGGYHYRLVAANSAGANRGADQTFVASIPPVVSGESVSNVAPVTSGTSVRATVAALLDAGGLASTYHVDYGTSAAYGSTTPETSVAGVVGPVGVAVHLGGLQPATTYHFRFVARNALGTTEGEDLTFTTAPLSEPSALLPDSRVYELVSVGPDVQSGDVHTPESSEGSEGFQIAGWPERASTDGNTLTYVAVPSPTGGNGEIGNGQGDQYLAVRLPQGGWTASNITPTGSSTSSGYVAFSNDLSVGIVQGNEPSPPLVPGGPQYGLYVRTSSDGAYHLLPQRKFFSPGSLGETADFSHVVISSEEEGNLEEYDWASGTSSPVNVLPGGATSPNPVLDSVSSGGSLIVWSGSDGNLYARENEGTPQERTVQVDASQGAGGGGGGSFGAASADGSKVFFTDSDSAGLTGDTVPGSGVNLYEFASGHLSDLTAASTAEVQSVVGSSSDGAYVYFIATGDLAAGATVGQPNLYLRHGGVTSFVATNAAGMEVAPDGRHLLLRSSASRAVYVYDAEAHELACASCNGNGEPVAVHLGNQPSGENLSGGFVPQKPHWMSEDGSRVFFEGGSLVPQATAGGVYEWERDGTGSCQTAAGCIYLLSGGAHEAVFLDASADGSDVFFITRAQLLPQDNNHYFDVYDARVNGYRPVSPPSCTGTGCQGVPPTPPIFATPSSATFNGVGNFEPPAKAVVKPKSKPKKCKRGFVKKHGRCVKNVKKRAKKSSTRSERGRK